MDRKELVEKTKHSVIRTETWEKIFPIINSILNTQLGRGLVEEDIRRFQYLYEKILNGSFDDMSRDDFVELKFLQNRILTLSKRMS